MSKRDELYEEASNKIRSNMHRAIELIRMVRELMPANKIPEYDYDFYEVLGIALEALNKNEELFDKHEADIMKLKFEE